jgi:hypothetical protein
MESHGTHWAFATGRRLVGEHLRFVPSKYDFWDLSHGAIRLSFSSAGSCGVRRKRLRGTQDLLQRFNVTIPSNFHASQASFERYETRCGRAGWRQASGVNILL